MGLVGKTQRGTLECGGLESLASFRLVLTFLGSFFDGLGSVFTVRIVLKRVGHVDCDLGSFSDVYWGSLTGGRC